MNICKDCYPDCIHCKHSIQDKTAKDGKYIHIAVIGCSLHSDQNHQELAKGRHYCRDFDCPFANPEGESKYESN